MTIQQVFHKVAQSPEIELNLNIFFMTMVVSILLALSIINFKTAVLGHITQSYLWGALLLVFALMQLFGLKNLILAKIEIIKSNKTMKKMNVINPEEITPEKIEELLKENEKKQKIKTRL